MVIKSLRSKRRMSSRSNRLRNDLSNSAGRKYRKGVAKENKLLGIYGSYLFKRFTILYDDN